MQAKRQELQRQLAKARPTPAQNEKRQSEEDLRLLFRRRRRGPGLGDRGPASSFLCCLSRSPSSPRPAARAPPEATQARSERAHSKVAVFSTSHEETSRGAAMTSRMRSVRTLLVKNRLQRGPQNQTPQTLAEAFSLDRQDAEEAARRGPARASLGRDCLLLRSTCGSPTRLPRRPPARAAPPRASWWGGALPPSILTAGSGHALALFEEVEDSDSESRERPEGGLRPQTRTRGNWAPHAPQGSCEGSSKISKPEQPQKEEVQTQVAAVARLSKSFPSPRPAEEIPVYNPDSQSYPDEINPQSNPLTHSLLPLCDQAVCPVWLGPVLSQCHSASLHPLMHLEHSCAH